MDPGVGMGSVGGVLVSVWWRPAALESVRKLHEEAIAVARREGSVLFVLIVEAGTRLSPAESREAAARMLRELGPAVRGVAVVIEGAGFGPAAVRAMFTGLGLFVRPGFPWKMFATESEAIRWVGEVDSARPALVRSVTRLAESLRPRAGS